MKHLTLIASIVLLVSLALGSTATYISDNEGEGPESEYALGFGSDEVRQIEFEYEEQEGLDISTPENTSFNPEEASKRFQMSGEVLPIEEYSIYVESVDPVKEVYTIPVIVRAFNQKEVEESAQIVHEREYNLYYRSQISEVYGFEGDLISPSEEAEEGLNDIEEFENEESAHNISVENSLMNDNETSTEEPEENSEISYPLLIAIIVVFGFILKETLL